MIYRSLGRSGLKVFPLALGTMIFGEVSERSTPPDQADQIIQHYLAQGGNHIDTADVYAQGRSEEIIGRAIRGKRDGIILATKVRFPTGQGPNDWGLSRYHIIQSVEASLRRLQTDVIDLLYMHGWDAHTSLEEPLRAFDDLVCAGKVRYTGVSNFKAWQMMKALGISRENGWVGYIAAQYQYSLVERDIESEFTELCVSEGVGLVPWGPLGGGYLSGKYKPGQKPAKPAEGRLAVALDEHEEAWQRRTRPQNWRILAEMKALRSQYTGSTYAQIALAWLLAQPAVATVVIGVRTMAQLLDNLKATELHLSAEDLERLSSASAIDPGYPYRLIEQYN